MSSNTDRPSVPSSTTAAAAGAAAAATTGPTGSVAPPGAAHAVRGRHEPGQPDRLPLDLSLAQVVGSVLAAVSATVVTSRFGVAGTVVGAAVASTVATIGTALYVHFLRTGRAALAGSRAPLPAANPQQPVLPTSVGAGSVGARPRRRALALAVAPLVVGTMALGGITAVESLTGRTLSGLVGGQHGDTTGTSIGHVARSVEGRAVAPVRRSRTVEPTVSPGGGGSPSPTPSRGGAAAAPSSPPADSAPAVVPSTPASDGPTVAPPATGAAPSQDSPTTPAG